MVGHSTSAIPDGSDRPAPRAQPIWNVDRATFDECLDGRLPTPERSGLANRDSGMSSRYNRSDTDELVASSNHEGGVRTARQAHPAVEDRIEDGLKIGRR